MTLTEPYSTVRAPELIIDGEIVATKDRRAVINPATGQPFIEVPEATVEDLDQAIAASHRAARSWARTPIAERQEAVRRFNDAVRDHIDELALLVTLEQGKPLPNAKGEINSGLRYCDNYAQMTLPTEVVRDDESERVEIRRSPLGVVGAITAWNYPLLLALWKIGPALVAGNSVIVKPSPFTPVATMRLAEIANEVLPPALLQTIAGGDDLGPALTSHPTVRKISFTGSVATGKAIMANAAGTMKRVTLELGGNDAGIVLGDADPAAIASDLYWGGLSNCGQVCAGLKRLYVPEALADEIEAALADVAKSVKVGNGLEDGVQTGPIQNAMQHKRVSGLIEDARQRGADVYFQGEAPDGPGYFHPVTLVRGVDDDVPLVAEEQFGPVLPILTYGTEAEAIERANASDLGLGASVWSPDEDHATAVAEQLEAGTSWVNQHPMLSPDTPFGGVKESGVGVESSLHGLLAFTDITVLRVKR